MNLVKANESVMIRVATRLCSGNRELAEDCVQDAVVSAYQSYMNHKFQDLSRFRPWILTILTNAFLVRQRYLSRVVPSDDIEHLVDAKHQMIAPIGLQDEQLSDDLQFALRSLSPEHRACIVLIDIEQIEYSEVAKMLKVPIGTVRSRINRARIKMAKDVLRFRSMEKIHE